MRFRVTRRTLAVGLISGLAACLGISGDGNGTDSGDGDSGDDEGSSGGAADGGETNPALTAATQRGELRLTSRAFDDGEPIPEQYGYEETNVNPPLSIENVPEGAESLVLVVDDPDAVEPAGKIWVHWLVWNIPPERTTIPEGWNPTDAVQGDNDFGEFGYGGPAPPDQPHTYRFKLYALDAALDLSRGATVEDLGPAMEGHVIARTQLTGTYAP